LLRDEDALQEEILQGLIRSVKMPLPSLQNPPSRKEILFPAHTISVCVNEMWHLGYIQESERLLFNVMDTIQKQFFVKKKKKKKKKKEKKSFLVGFLTHFI
jgi:myosin-5